MITHKICDDGSIEFNFPGGSVLESPLGGETCDKLTIENAKELVELAREIQDAKFDFCKKFKCSLDKSKCF